MFLGVWFWLVEDGFGCLQKVLCDWSFSSHGEIRALNLKEVSGSNDAKIPLKQMTKFLDNSSYKVSLKRSLGGWEIWKFTYIALCEIDIYSYMWIPPVLTPFLPILGQFFQGSSHLAYCWLAGLYSRLSIWQIFLFIETLL